jgi:hypothetical protein
MPTRWCSAAHWISSTAAARRGARTVRRHPARAREAPVMRFRIFTCSPSSRSHQHLVPELAGPRPGAAAARRGGGPPGLLPQERRADRLRCQRRTPACASRPSASIKSITATRCSVQRPRRLPGAERPGAGSWWATPATFERRQGRRCRGQRAAAGREPDRAAPARRDPHRHAELRRGPIHRQHPARRAHRFRRIP